MGKKNTNMEKGIKQIIAIEKLALKIKKELKRVKRESFDINTNVENSDQFMDQELGVLVTRLEQLQKEIKWM